jgi:diketogulonate reductase-like aldo/keto reductase
MKALAAQAPTSGNPKAGGATVKLNNNISFGVASFGLQIYGNDKAQQLTTIALKAGFRNFFASVLAGNQRGFGAAIRATHVPRSEIFVCGSVNTGDCHGMAQCKAETAKGCRDNLRDLGTAVGVLDMIMLDYPAHNCDGIKGQWAAFEAMLKSGTTKSIAVSNFSPEQLDCIVKDPTLTVPAVNQMPFSVSSDDSVLRANKQRGNIFVQAYSPLQSGRLVEDADCATIGRAHGGKSAAQVALKYILQKGAGFTTSALTASEFREDIGLFDWALSKAEMAKLDARASGPGH